MIVHRPEIMEMRAGVDSTRRVHGCVGSRMRRVFCSEHLLDDLHFVLLAVLIDYEEFAFLNRCPIFASVMSGEELERTVTNEAWPAYVGPARTAPCRN